MGKAEEAIHAISCLVWVFESILFITFETSISVFLFRFSMKAFLSSCLTGALKPTLEHWKSGVSESCAKHWLAGSFLFSGVLADLEPQLWCPVTRGPLGSQLYRWSHIEGLIYTVWQWFEGNSLLKVFRSWSWRKYCCTDPQHIADNFISTVRGLS